MRDHAGHRHQRCRTRMPSTTAAASTPLSSVSCVTTSSHGTCFCAAQVDALISGRLQRISRQFASR